MEQEVLGIWKAVAGITNIKWYGRLISEIQSTPK